MRLKLLLLSLFLISCNNNTTVESPDCAGVSGGNAVEDCAGECGGSAVLDACGVCGGIISSSDECPDASCDFEV